MNINRLYFICLLIFLCILSSYSFGFSGDDFDSCVGYYSFANIAIKVRQENLPYEYVRKFFTNKDNNISKVIIDEAYTIPIYENTVDKKNIIYDFSMKWYKYCKSRRKD